MYHLRSRRKNIHKNAYAAIHTPVTFHPRRHITISSTRSWNQNIGPAFATNRLKLFVVVGSDSATFVVSSFPSPGVSSGFEGNDPAPRVDDSSICGRIENELPVGEVSDGTDDTDEELL